MYKPFYKPQQPKFNFKINEQISAKELRVIGDVGEIFGIMSREDALNLAKEKGLDLIEIASTATPPVAKIINYDKFRYQKEKELKKQKAAQKGGELKQIRIGAKIAKHDLETKIKKIEEFFEDGNKVEITLVLRGREKYNREWAFIKIREFMQMIPFEYKVLIEPKFGGKGLITQITKK